MTTVRHKKQMFTLSHSDEVLKTEEEPLAFSFHGHDQTKNRRTVNQWTGATTDNPTSKASTGEHRHCYVTFKI